MTKAAAAKSKEKEAAAQKKKKKPETSDDEDDEEDPYKAPSKGVLNGITGDAPPIGTFQNCVECGKKFTVSKYTLAADPGPGFLCHVCAKSSGIDPFKKKAEPRKKKTEKRVVQNFEEVEPVKSLTAMCIEVRWSFYILGAYLDKTLRKLVNLSIVSKSLAISEQPTWTKFAKSSPRIEA